MQLLRALSSSGRLEFTPGNSECLVRVSWFGNVHFECLIENVTFCISLQLPTKKLAPYVKSAPDVRESVDTIDTDTPRCEPQDCCNKWMEEGKTCQAMWDTVASGIATHFTPRVSIAISIRNMASCSLQQTCHCQLLCFRLTRQLNTWINLINYQDLNKELIQRNPRFTCVILAK